MPKFDRMCRKAAERHSGKPLSQNNLDKNPVRVVSPQQTDYLFTKTRINQKCFRSAKFLISPFTYVLVGFDGLPDFSITASGFRTKPGYAKQRGGTGAGCPEKHERYTGIIYCIYSGIADSAASGKNDITIRNIIA